MPYSVEVIGLLFGQAGEFILDDQFIEHHPVEHIDLGPREFAPTDAPHGWAIPAAPRIGEGRPVRVDPLAGTVENLTTGETLEAEPLPEHLLTMIADGGLLAHLEKKFTPGK